SAALIASAGKGPTRKAGYFGLISLRFTFRLTTHIQSVPPPEFASGRPEGHRQPTPARLLVPPRGHRVRNGFAHRGVERFQLSPSGLTLQAMAQRASQLLKAAGRLRGWRHCFPPLCC